MQEIMREMSNFGVWFVIARDADDYYVFTEDEWDMGEGYRYPTLDFGSYDSAYEFVQCVEEEEYLPF